jgi:plasmid maintenance system antidote protein VapI
LSKEALIALDNFIKEPLTFGEMIKTIRQTEYDKMTKQAFAELIGISKSRLSGIENNRKLISITKAIEMANKLGQSKRFFVMVAMQDMLSRNNLNYRVEINPV